MALEGYVSIHGREQGPFRGNPKRESGVSVLKFSYAVEAPRDVATGQASGKRQHEPIKITKEWGASSPQIFQALVSNEVLDSVVIEFVNQNRSRQERPSKIHLTNAHVLQVRYIGGGKDEVVFVFEDISASGGAPPLEARLAFITAAL